MHPYDISQIKKTSPYLCQALKKYGLDLLKFLTVEVPLKFDWWNDQDMCYYAYYQTPLLKSGPCDKCQKEAYLHMTSPYTSPREAWCIECIIRAWEDGDERYDKYTDPESPEYSYEYAHPVGCFEPVTCILFDEDVPIDRPADEA